MAPYDLDKLIEKYLEGKCTKEEREFIDSWYSTLGRKGPIPPPHVSEDQLAAAGDRILQHLQAHTNSGTVDEPADRQGTFFWHYTGIAACLLIGLATAFYFIPSGIESPLVSEQAAPLPFTSVENTSELLKRVILPDGSIVEMSPESNIRFSNDTASAVRELFLEGEAYFDVAHNQKRPFFVYAGNVVTKVLGTSFIVRAIGVDAKITVSVKTGKVTVYSKNAIHKKTVLVPNQKAVYDVATDVVATQVVPAETLPAEKRHFTEMHFEETPVSQVLTTLMETYDIDIIFAPEALSGCVLTSSFFEEGLYDRIDVICTAIGATYKIVDAQILIESKGCNLKP